MILQCNDARPLVPAYVDGELSEAQAGLLRKHLLDCAECRGSVQEGKSLQRWFAAERESAQSFAASTIPSGFAARVARRAFAGDTGERGFPVASAVHSGRGEDRERTLRFVLQLTSVAALALIALSIGIRMNQLPAGHLRADDRALVSVEEIQRECERLDRIEKGLPPLPVEPASRPQRAARSGAPSAVPASTSRRP